MIYYAIAIPLAILAGAGFFVLRFWYDSQRPRNSRELLQEIRDELREIKEEIQDLKSEILQGRLSK